MEKLTGRMIEEKSYEASKNTNSLRINSNFSCEIIDQSSKDKTSVNIIIDQILNDVHKTMLIKVVEPDGKTTSRITNLTDSFIKEGGEWKPSPTRGQDVLEVLDAFSKKMDPNDFKDSDVLEVDDGYILTSPFTEKEEKEVLVHFMPIIEMFGAENKIKERTSISKFGKDFKREKEMKKIVIEHEGILTMNIVLDMNILDIDKYNDLKLNKEILALM